MTEALEQAVAKLRTAQLSAGAAARADDGAVGQHAAIRQHGFKFSVLFAQKLHLAARAQLDVFPLCKCEAQHVNDAVGAVTDGVDAAGRLCNSQKSETAKKLQRSFLIEAHERTFAKI